MAHFEIQQGGVAVRVRRIAGQMAAAEMAISDDAVCNTVLHSVAGVGGAVGGRSRLNEVHEIAHLTVEHRL